MHVAREHPIDGAGRMMNRLFRGLFLLCAISSAADCASADEVKRMIQGIESYRQSYILLDSYNDHYNYNSIYGPAVGNTYMHQEVKFQISFQGVIADIGSKELGFSYTQQSYWQLYNTPLSAPFRETNYEPELFIRWQDSENPLLGKDTFYRLGFDHQSNGQSQPHSRSWNRLYGEVKLQDPNDVWVGALRAWWRIPEKASRDDNPNITQYYGFWQFDGRWTPYEDQKIHIMLRDNLHAKNKGAVQLDWSWKVFHDFSLYAQGFYGYGESLIEHNYVSARVGAGILLTNR